MRDAVYAHLDHSVPAMLDSADSTAHLGLGNFPCTVCGWDGGASSVEGGDPWYWEVTAVVRICRLIRILLAGMPSQPVEREICNVQHAMTRAALT